MEIEPKKSHAFKIDPIKFQIWKQQIFNFFTAGCPYESGRPFTSGDFQKSGRPYLKGILKKRPHLYQRDSKKAAALISKGF
jgi:hypothetical protein